MNETWILLIFVVVTNAMNLLAVTVGAYFVYRTKREDGYMFKSQQLEEKGGAIHLDDFGSPGDDEDFTPPADQMAKNMEFLKNLGIRETNSEQRKEESTGI